MEAKYGPNASTKSSMECFHSSTLMRDVDCNMMTCGQMHIG